MSIKCKVCGTVWVHQQKKCPKCGADSNGNKGPAKTVFSLLQPALDPAPTPEDFLADTTRRIDADYSSPPSSDSFSSGGGGDFAGGGGGSDFGGGSGD